MSARLLRVPIAALEPGVGPLPAGAAAYVTRVHRLRAGDRCLFFDPERAVEADAELLEVGRREVLARVGALRPAALRPAREATLLQAVGKGDTMDAIVRDATELGATRIVPVLAARSVAHPDARRSDRWRRIAVEAARQCGRGDAPRIDAPAPLAEALRGAVPAAGFCLDPEAEEPLGRALARLAPGVGVAFLVGPEGGLTAAELAEAERAGFARVAFGSLVLRTETVCAAVLGALLAFTGWSAETSR